MRQINLVSWNLYKRSAVKDCLSPFCAHRSSMQPNVLCHHYVKPFLCVMWRPLTASSCFGRFNSCFFLQSGVTPEKQPRYERTYCSTFNQLNQWLTCECANKASATKHTLYAPVCHQPWGEPPKDEHLLSLCTFLHIQIWLASQKCFLWDYFMKCTPISWSSSKSYQSKWP